MENNSFMNNEEFKKGFYYILKRALFCSEITRRDGLLALEDVMDHEKAENRDIFEYGLRFIIDGTDGPLVDKILSNIINQEKNEMWFLLMTIQKDAVLQIQAGNNPRVIACCLNSYTNIPLNDPEFKKIIDDSDIGVLM
jgi:flagellar motor component MotA